MKSYKIKELFYTLQGEGAHSGRPAVFCRFTGCNLWSGRETDRLLAICKFCDTDFVGTNGINGGVYSAQELVDKAFSLWPQKQEGVPFVVCTGGEPLLQLDSHLIQAFKTAGFVIAIETNGTILPPEGIDWVCVSPKAGAELRLKYGNELKLVFPQAGAMPEAFSNLAFDHFFIQPMYGPDLQENTAIAINYCLQNPKWQLSLQTHKMLGIP